ncbi:MAG: amidohydrolase [Rikenellaceae bacterium]
MTLMRNMTDDVELMKWLTEHIWPMEAKLTGDDIEAGARLGIAEMLLGGTTSFVDMYWQSHRVAGAAEELGIRALVSLCVLDHTVENMEADFAPLRAIADRSPLITAGLGPHAPYTCSPETLDRVAEFSAENGIPLNIHLSEAPSEAAIIDERYGMEPTAYLDAHNILRPTTILAHAIHLSDEAIETIAARGASIASNPQSNMKLASGIAPIVKLQSAGVNCTVGTDGASSNNDLDMWDELRTLSLLQKVENMEPTTLPDYESLKLVTVNGARALGMEGKLGILRAGALADIIAVDLSKPHHRPRHNPLASLLYCARASDVAMVMIGGKIVVHEGKLLSADIEEICSRAEAAVAALQARN